MPSLRKFKKQNGSKQVTFNGERHIHLEVLNLEEDIVDDLYKGI